MTTVSEFLDHHGVKGMKWGVRKDKGHEGESAKTKKIAKLDKRFERNANSLNLVLGLHNEAAKQTNLHDVDRINNDPRYRDHDFSRDSPLRQQYYREHQTAFINNLERAASDLGTNASGTRRYNIVELPDGSWDVHTTEVSHAADEENVIRVNVTYDSKGRIVSLEINDDFLSQSEFTTIDDFLEHYGVKGMKWGVRRKSGSSGNSDKPDPKKLSDAELKAVVARMQLERQFNTLHNNRSTHSGAAFIRDMALNVARSELQSLAARQLRRVLTSVVG